MARRGCAGPFTVLLCLTVVIGATAYAYFEYQAQEVHRAVAETLSAIADLKVREILDWREERLTSAQSIALNPLAGHHVQAYVAGPDDNQLRAPLSVWLKALRGHHQSSRASLLDSQPNVRLTSPDGEASLCSTALAAAQEAQRTGQAVFSDLHHGPPRDGIHLDLAIPLLSSEEWESHEPSDMPAASSPMQSVGVIVLEVDPYVFLYPRIQVWPTSSPTAETLLVRREGNEVVFLNELRHREGTALSLRMSLDEQPALPAAMAARGAEGAIEGVDYRGAPVLAAMRSIPGTPWHLVAKIDQSEVVATLRERAWITGIVALILLVAAGLGVGLFGRHREARRLHEQLVLEQERRRTETAARVSVARLERISSSNVVGVAIADARGRVLEANDYYLNVLGYTRAEFEAGAIRLDKRTPPEHLSPDGQALAALRAQGICAPYEKEYLRRDGSRVWVLIAKAIVPGPVEQIVALAVDVTERKRAEQAARAADAHYRRLYESMMDAYVRVDMDGVVQECNEAYRTMLGYTEEELRGLTYHELTPPKWREHEARIMSEQVLVRGHSDTYTKEYRRKDGSVFPVELRAFLLRDEEGRPASMWGIVRDITARTREERERATTIEFLRLVNKTTGVRELVEAATRFFKEQSGCEAVGIRLRDGDDYPYYEARGFPAEFVLAENSLCERDSAGEILRDDSGNPVIACMCGNVICGRFDPSQPFFTQAGSFWTNSTTQLLASTTAADRQTRTRNRCNGEGYESVALIALRSGEQRQGLLQLNDRRKGLFTPADIAVWERLAGYLAVALAKAQAEEALRQSEQRLSWALQAGQGGVWHWDLTSGAAWWSREMYPLWGVAPGKPMNTENSLSLVDARDREHVRDAIAGCIAKHTEPHWEFRIQHPARGERWMTTHGRVSFDDAGGATRMLGITLDVTERRQTEESLRKSEALLVRAEQIANIGCWEWEIASGKLTWSRQTYNIFGVEPERFAPDHASFLDRVHPDDRQRVTDALDGAIANRGPYDVEYRIVPQDARPRWVQSRGEATRDAAQRPIRMTGTVLDITERKLAEAALRESEERYRSLFNGMTEGFALHEIICDAAGTPCDYRFLEINPGFERLTGLKREDVLGKTLRDVLPDEDPCWVSVYGAVALTGESVQFDRYSPALQRHYEVFAYRPAPRQFAVLFVDITERKQAEAEVLLKNALLEAQTETGIDGILIVDKEGKVVLSNRRFAEMWNVPAAVLATRADRPLLRHVSEQMNDPGDFVDRVRHLYDHQKATSRDELELRDGRVFDRYSSPLIDANGTLHGRIWYFRDITARKQAEAAVQQSAEKVRAIVENIGIGVALIGPDMRILELNRQMRTWFPNVDPGRGPICYESFNDPPRAAICSYCPTHLTLRDGQVHEAVTETPQSCGARNYRVVSSPVRNSQGDVIAAIEMVEDITDRRRAEQAIAETGQHQIAINRLQQDLLGPGELVEKLKQITAAAVRLFDVDFCRIWVTKPGDRCRSGCIHAEATEGLHVCRQREHCLHLIASSGRYTHTDGRGHRRVPLGSYKIGLLASGAEKKVLTNDVANDPRIHDPQWAGQLGLVSFAGYQLRPPGGETIGVLALFSKHTITPEVDAVLESLANTATQVIQNARAEEEQRSLQAQLAQAQRLESVGQLAAGIAHEINTPTQFVSDNARFLQNAFPRLQDVVVRYQELLAACRSGSVPPNLLDDLEAAAGNAKLDYLLEQIPGALSDSLEGLERVTKIVRAMKDFAHPGPQSMHAADLNKAIESTVTVARNEWKYVADVKLDLDPALPQVPCLVADFNQVILNIVVNAAHAIADVGGDGSKGKGTITVSTRQADRHAEIRISDTGPGIPEENRGKIFNQFFTTKEVGKGTGQGLAMARHVIVEKHHGTLTFETQVGRGTTFIVRLPIEPESDASKARTEHDDLCATR